ncbi:hypothetical protein M8494_34460 (plasmid) [Serratia ureilytica]
MSHTTGIHLPDQKIALRNPVQGHNQEVAAFMAYESAVANPGGGQPPPYRLNCLDMPEALYEGVTSALVAPDYINKKARTTTAKNTFIFLHMDSMNRKSI